MNPVFTVWIQLLLLLAAEVALVAALATLLERTMKSAFWRRTIWQASVLALGMLAVSEMTGVGREVLGRFARQWASAESKEGEDILNAGAPQLTAKFREEVAGRLAARPQDRLISTASPFSGPASLPAETHPASLEHSRSPRPGALWIPGLMLLWILGAAIVAGYAFVARLVLAALRRSWRRVADPAICSRISRLKEELGVRGRVRLVESARLTGPIAFGLFRPTIGLPDDFSQNFSARQQEAMLAHELAHLAARDPFWYLLANLTTAALWWHPLAWWARRRLYAASETAADEASLLVADGPGALAECLVAMGNRLTRPRVFSPLGVAGFRSNLGRRVERLLSLRGRVWTRHNRLCVLLARTLAPGVLVVTAILCTAWATPGPTKGEAMSTMRQTWKQLLAAFALVTTLGTENTLTPATIAEEASSSGKAEPAGSRAKPGSAKPSAASSGSEPSPAEPLMKVFRLDHSDPTDMAAALKPALSDQSRIVPDARARQLVVLGTEKELQDVGLLIEKLDQAPAGKAPDRSAAYEEILRHHNYNQLMLERYGLIPKGSTLAANAPSASPDELMRQRYGLPVAKKHKGRVESKLEDIQLEEVTFDGLPLPEVLQFLSEESRKRDPDKKGINFLINPNVLPVASAPMVDPTTGQLIPTPAPEPLDMNNVIVRFNLPLREVRLKDVLDAVVKVADRAVEYSVEEYGVVFSAKLESHAGGAPVSPQPVGAGPLQVRTFRVDTNTFLAGLERAFGIRLGSGPGVNDYDAEKIRIKLAQAERDMKRIAKNVETGLVPTDDLEKAKLTRDLLALDLKQAESGRGRPDANQGTGPAREVQDALRRLLVQLGINMEAPGKSIFYNELTGILMVRATFDDLNVVQAAIETLGGSGVEPGASVDPRRDGRAQNGATPYNEEMMRRYGLLPAGK